MINRIAVVITCGNSDCCAKLSPPVCNPDQSEHFYDNRYNRWEFWCQLLKNFLTRPFRNSIEFWIQNTILSFKSFFLCDEKLALLVGQWTSPRQSAGNWTRQISQSRPHTHYNLCNLRNLWIKTREPVEWLISAHNMKTSIRRSIRF